MQRSDIFSTHKAFDHLFGTLKAAGVQETHCSLTPTRGRLPAKSPQVGMQESKIVRDDFDSRDRLTGFTN
jgi:hypothetical protein